MAEIAGISIEYTDYVSATTPRILKIPAAHGNASAQDIWDTLSAEAAKLDNLIYKKMLDRPQGGGKSDLTGGRFTGIVLPLNNIQVQFEESFAVLESGTVTTPDTTGKILIDSTALFQTNNVLRGDLIHNNTDNSHATVTRVVSEQELRTTALVGGTDNEYGSGDAYEIINQIQRDIIEGDAIAFDSGGSGMDPRLSSFGVDTGLSRSTSPALVLETGQPAKGVAFPNFKFVMKLSSDHVSPATGKAVSGFIAKDAETSFTALTNSVVEMAFGYYKVDLTAAEMDADILALRFTASASDTTEIVLVPAS